jgi:hypothetical protein
MVEAISVGACDLSMPDLARIGGVTGWMQAAGIAAAHGLPMSSHLLPEVSVHLLSATPTCHFVEYVDWADSILEQPLRVEKGEVRAPDRPGSDSPGRRTRSSGSAWGASRYGASLFSASALSRWLLTCQWAVEASSRSRPDLLLLGGPQRALLALRPDPGCRGCLSLERACASFAGLWRRRSQ